MEITKKQFKKIVIFFSIILLLDYPILPWILSFLSKDYQCEYDNLTCLGMSFALMTIVGLFWYLIVMANNIMFFTNYYKTRYDFDGFKKEPLTLLFLKCLFVKKYYLEYSIK